MTTRTRSARMARDIMTPDPVRVPAGTTARELARILDANEISGVPVVDPIDRVIGVVSRSDLIHRCVEGPIGSDPGSLFETVAAGLADGATIDTKALGTVEDFMSPEPVTARPDDSIGALAARMATERVHRVIVTDDADHVLGIVTSLDLLGAFAE